MAKTPATLGGAHLGGKRARVSVERLASRKKAYHIIGVTADSLALTLQTLPGQPVVLRNFAREGMIVQQDNESAAGRGRPPERVGQSTRVDVEALKERVGDQWLDVLRDLAPELEEACDEFPEHVACPMHGGRDGFRFFDDAEETGGGICNTPSRVWPSWPVQACLTSRSSLGTRTSP